MTELETLAREAEDLRLEVRTLIASSHAMDPQQALLSKGLKLQALSDMLKRFDGVDLAQHGLQRLKNQLTALKPQLQKLRVQTGSHQKPKTSSRQSRRGQNHQNQSLNVRKQPALPRRRAK